jgi:hypothetical protein
LSNKKSVYTAISANPEAEHSAATASTGKTTSASEKEAAMANVMLTSETAKDPNKPFKLRVEDVCGKFDVSRRL